MSKKTRESSWVDVANKAFGASSVIRPGEDHKEKIETVSTGSFTVDRALRIGGLPRGKFVEIFGPESSGKTTMCLHIIANAQRAGLQCLYIDAEQAVDLNYAEKLGVNLNDLCFAQPDSGEHALQIADAAVTSGEVGVVVVDSVAALVPTAELEGDVTDNHMGLQARLMGKAIRKLTPGVSKNKVLFIFINQVRSKIGVVYGSPETTPGGRALDFGASVRLRIGRCGKAGDNGNRTRVEVRKSRVGVPHGVAEFDLEWGVGIVREGELIDVGVELGVIEKSGTWLSFKGHKLGQGRENGKNCLREDPGLARGIEEAIIAASAPS